MTDPKCAWEGVMEARGKCGSLIYAKEAATEVARKVRPRSEEGVTAEQLGRKVLLCREGRHDPLESHTEGTIPSGGSCDQDRRKVQPKEHGRRDHELPLRESAIHLTRQARSFRDATRKARSGGEVGAPSEHEEGATPNHWQGRNDQCLTEQAVATEDRRGTLRQARR